MLKLKCKDIMPDLQMGVCSYEVAADTEEELVSKIKEHVNHAHNACTLPPDLATRVKKSVKK